MLPLPSHPASIQRLSAVTTTSHDRNDIVSCQLDPDWPLGYERPSLLTSSYGVQDVWQLNSCSAEIPESLWCTQDSNSTLLLQIPDGASIFGAQVPFDNMP